MTADFNLSGRVAIITGGNGGIGLGMAKALGRAGCTVSIWGRNAEKNRDALAELSKLGASAEARSCDVTDRRAIEDAFAATLDGSAGSTAALPTPGSEATASRLSLTAPRTTGGACFRPISTASFTSTRSRSGT